MFPPRSKVRIESSEQGGKTEGVAEHTSVDSTGYWSVGERDASPFPLSLRSAKMQFVASIHQSYGRVTSFQGGPCGGATTAKWLTST